MKSNVLILTALALACAAPAKAEPAPAVQITLPQGWTRTSAGAGIERLAAKNGEMTLTLVDAIDAVDARAAASEAWQKARGETRKVDTLALFPSESGWDEGGNARMENPPGDERRRSVLLYREKSRWRALVVDMPAKDFVRFNADVVTVAEGISPAGWTRETFAGRKARPLTPERIEALRQFVRQGMKEFNIVGASMALVQDGKIVAEEGFGVRRRGEAAKVDARTRFQIASNTKGMTTLLLASLVSDGRLGWDDKVKDIFPEFRLGDAATTDKVQIRHLICACTGMPRNDLVWIFNSSPDTDARQAFRILASTQPTTGFGERYQYSNSLAAAAGYVAAYRLYPGMELGAAYDRAMQERVFGPLGMKDTTFSYATALAGNHATGYAIASSPVPEAVDDGFGSWIHPQRPTGGAWSTAHDMALYAMNELSVGRLSDGRQMMAREALLERRKPGVAVGKDQSYGMGLQIDRSSGVDVIEHGGHMPGFLTGFFVVPDANAAAVLLTSDDDNRVFSDDFRRRFLEILYDGEPKAEDFLVADAKGVRDRVRAELAKLDLEPDDGIVNALAPAYANDQLGSIVVHREGKRLRFDFPHWSARMASRTNPDGSVEIVSLKPGYAGFSYLVGKDGAGRPTLTMSDGQNKFLFTASR